MGTRDQDAEMGEMELKLVELLPISWPSRWNSKFSSSDQQVIIYITI